MNWADEPRMGRPAAHRTPAEPVDVPTTTNLAERAEAIRRTATRMASNSARTRAGLRRADLDTGAATATPEPA